MRMTRAWERKPTVGAMAEHHMHGRWPTCLPGTRTSALACLEGADPPFSLLATAWTERTRAWRRLGCRALPGGVQHGEGNGKVAVRRVRGSLTISRRT